MVLSTYPLSEEALHTCRVVLVLFYYMLPSFPPHSWNQENFPVLPVIGLCACTLKGSLCATCGIKFFFSHPLSFFPCSSPISVLCPPPLPFLVPGPLGTHADSGCFWAIKLLRLMSSGINMSSGSYSKIGTAGNSERDSDSPSAGLIWCIYVCSAVWHLLGNDNLQTF